jgi:CxxC-x17-CxxC domain-containing protein
MQNFKKDGFKKQGGFSDRKPFGKPSFGGKSDFKKKIWDTKDKGFDDRPMHTAICSGCGKSCQVPFVPAPGKPVFCDNCFMKTRNGENPMRNNTSTAPAYNNYDIKSVNSANDVVARQLQVIAGKLDILIDLLSHKEPIEKNIPEEVNTKRVKKEISKKTATKKVVKKVTKVIRKK